MSLRIILRHTQDDPEFIEGSSVDLRAYRTYLSLVKSNSGFSSIMRFYQKDGFKRLETGSDYLSNIAIQTNVQRLKFRHLVYKVLLGLV